MHVYVSRTRLQILKERRLKCHKEQIWPSCACREAGQSSDILSWEEKNPEREREIHNKLNIFVVYMIFKCYLKTIFHSLSFFID